MILGDLSELVSGISYSSVKVLDVSKCSLGDSHSVCIQELLKTSSLSGLNLESNSFKTLNLYQVLCENHYIEDFNISHNPLGLNEVLALMDALVINKSLKILGIQGFNNILFDQKLADVLKRSFLIVLRYDLGVLDLNVVKEVENTLMMHNRCLVSIESKGIDWDGLNVKHPLYQIKKALKANLWLSQNEDLPSEVNDEIFMDVQDVIIMKQKVEKSERNEIFEEDEMIAMEYDKIPEVVYESFELNRKNDLKIMPGEEIIDDRSDKIENFGGVKDFREFDLPSNDKFQSLKENKNLDIRIPGNMDQIHQILENFETKFEKALLKVSDNILKIEDKLESQQEDLDSIKNTISNKLNKLTEQIEIEVTTFTSKYKHLTSKLEEKMIQLENKDERKSTLLKEIAEQYEITQETLKDLDSRLDELDHSIKSKPSPKPEQIQTKSLSLPAEFLSDFKDLQEKISFFSSNLSKLTLFEDNLKKTSNKIENLKLDFSNFQSEISQNIADVEEKVTESFRFKSLVSSLQKEVYSKISSLDCKIIEIIENPLLQDLTFKVASAENRIVALEEKWFKCLSETNYTIKHRDQLIESRLAYLEQERLNIEELRSRLISRNDESMRESVMSRDKSLDERISSLEKMTTSKKPCNLRENILNTMNLR